MKINAWLVFGCIVQMSAHAAEIDHVAAPPGGQFSIHAVAAANLLPATTEPRSPIGAGQDPGLARRLASAPPRESPFALAIGRAAKKGVIEAAVEAYTDVLIQCQQAQSPVLTTPFIRSDSQQAHCYRF
jgi:hypothetical protein